MKTIKDQWGELAEALARVHTEKPPMRPTQLEALRSTFYAGFIQGVRNTVAAANLDSKEFQEWLRTIDLESKDFFQRIEANTVGHLFTTQDQH